MKNTGWHYKESGDNDSMRFPVVKPITTQDFKSEEGVDYTLAILKCFPFRNRLTIRIRNLGTPGLVQDPICETIKVLNFSANQLLSVDQTENVRNYF